MNRLIALVALFVLAFNLRADEPAKEAKKEPPKPAEFVIGEMHIQNLPAQNFIYGSAETTFDKMGDVINKYLPMLVQGIQEGKFIQKGGAMFIYRNMQDMTKPFTLEVGWCVTDNAKETGELKVRKAEAFKCATVLYTGPLANIGKAYEKIMAGVQQTGLTPTGESREMYLYFEKPESANNVVQIQIGIK